MTNSSRAAVGVRHVFLVIHGRTASDTDELLPVDDDEPLDDVGRVEAFALAESLDYVRPARVITSPQARARATAEVIATHAGVPVVPEPRLSDRSYGRWAGRPRAEVYAISDAELKSAGVESTGAVAARARAVLDEQLPSAEDARPIVLVTHPDVAQLLLATLDAHLTSRTEQAHRTATWNVLAAEGDHWQVLDTDEPPAESEPGE